MNGARKIMIMRYAITLLISGAVDFTPIDQTLIFSKEVTEINVTVMIVEDSVNEMREQFTANLQLTTSEASVIINPNVTTIFIEDDDRKLIIICNKVTI